jgi:GH35 family endo-1,4-beta-xylanase
VTCGGYSHPCDAKHFDLQAQIYGDVLEACLNNTRCTGFMSWGFSDLHSWMGTGKRP